MTSRQYNRRAYRDQGIERPPLKNAELYKYRADYLKANEVTKFASSSKIQKL